MEKLRALAVGVRHPKCAARDVEVDVLAESAREGLAHQSLEDDEDGAPASRREELVEERQVLLRPR